MAESICNEILVITDLSNRDSLQPVERGLAERLSQSSLKTIDASVLNANLQRFLDQLKQMLEAKTDTIRGYSLARVEVYAQITGEGQICLMGSGGKVGVQGGLKLVLERADDR